MKPQFLPAGLMASWPRALQGPAFAGLGGSPVAQRQGCDLWAGKPELECWDRKAGVSVRCSAFWSRRALVRTQHQRPDSRSVTEVLALFPGVGSSAFFHPLRPSGSLCPSPPPLCLTSISRMDCRWKMLPLGLSSPGSQVLEKNARLSMSTWIETRASPPPSVWFQARGSGSLEIMPPSQA